MSEPRRPQRQARYPKAGPVGGAMIREVIRALRNSVTPLPLTSHILCAISAGLDSTALAALLVHYGRRVGARERVRFLHVNHGWRGVESDRDEAFCRDLANRWGVPIDVIRLRDDDSLYRLSEGDLAGRSWEEAARETRKRIFADAAGRLGPGTVVLTAHHADDLAETLLWRLFSGSAASHGAGILRRDGVELRPLLSIRKARLQAFLEEEGLSWREDSSNQEGRFLRSRMRHDLMPVIETLFPRAVDHLVQAALRLQDGPSGREAAASGEKVDSKSGLFQPGTCLGAKESDTLSLAEVLFGAAALRTRKAHRAILEQALRSKPGRDANFEIHLPDNWKLIRRKTAHDGASDLTKRSKGSSFTERWILEKR